MRIVICNTLYPPIGIGGAERSVQFLAESLVKRGHAVTVLSQGMTWRPTHEVKNGVQLVRTSSPPGYSPNVYAHRSFSEKVLSRLFAKIQPQRSNLYMTEIERGRPDIVHTNAAGGLDELWVRTADLGIPIVHTLRNHGSLCPRRMFVEGRACEGQCTACAVRTMDRRNAGERLSGVVGISDYILQEHLTNGYFRSVKHRRVIPNSYESSEAGRERQAEVVTALGYLGRLHETKGVHQLVEAMRPFEGRARLLVAGTGNPQFVESLKAKAGPNVEFLGFVDADTVLTKLDALVVPSLWREPFGRIYAEALVHGVPVIGSVHGAGRELVSEGKTGWLCDPSNAPDLRAAIGRALDELSRPNEFRSNCRKAAMRFAPDAVAAAYEAFYETAIKAGATRKTKLSVAMMPSAAIGRSA